MEEFESERDRRVRAIELVDAGVAKAEVARRLGRSREWVHKWLARYRSEGQAGLTDRSRARMRQDRAFPVAVTERVLAVRHALEEDPVANIGALSILATLEREGFTPLPSIATIERILSRAGATRSTVTPAPVGAKLPLPRVTTPGVWQQADWVQDRYLTGGIRFNSLQIADVGSHGITAGQFLDRTLVTAVTFLLESAWPQLSIPQAISTDNAFTRTTHRHNPFTIWARVCLFYGVEVIIGPPGGHGWNNHIEAVNHLWQSRTIRAQHFRSLEELRAGSERACWWFNHHRPILDPDTHGTRYPAAYIKSHRHALHWPPPITVADHIDPDGALSIPLSAGRVTFIRHVTEHHTIRIAGGTWDIPTSIPVGGLITATITTDQHRLEIRHQGEPVATHPYPINHPIIDPYLPPADNSLLQHV